MMARDLDIDIGAVLGPTVSLHPRSTTMAIGLHAAIQTESVMLVQCTYMSLLIKNSINKNLVNSDEIIT